MMAPKRHRRRAVGVDADRGSTLVIVLVVVVVAGLVVVPMLEFGSTLLRFERVASAKTTRIEAVKGALRVALADPAGLYQRDCPTYNPMWTPSTGLELVDTRASGDDVRTGCELMGTAVADFGGRLANAFTAVGVAVPEGTQGSTYVTPDVASISAWFDADHASPEPADGKIWSPQLPVRTAIERTEVNGWAMPSDYGNCRVFFPGTYRSAITLTGGEVYFASGTYYFEAPLTFDGTVEVVVGEGTTPGCATDQEAAFDALAPPGQHGINGLGATFVFGGEGRLVLDTGTSEQQMVVFNQRYVAQDDVGLRSTHRVSIMTVNGTRTGPSTAGDLLVPHDFHAPLSTVAGTTPGSILTHGYEPSTRLAVAPRSTDADGASPVIKVTAGNQSSIVLRVAGYVAIPQGFVDVSNAVPSTGSSVAFDGGLLAAAAIERAGFSDTALTMAPQCAATSMLGPTVFTASASVPGFDTTLGRLVGVAVSFSGQASLINSVSSNGGPWKVSRNDNVGVFLTGPGMTALPPDSFLPDPAFPGYPNNALPSVPAGLAGSIVSNSWTSGDRNTATLSDNQVRSISGSVNVTSNLNVFAAPSVTLSAKLFSTRAVTTALNGSWTIGSQAAITACVAYTYLPAGKTVTQCAAAQSVSPSPATRTFTVPGFNSSLGDLIRVQVSFTGQSTFNNTVDTAAPTWRADRNDNVGVFLTGPGMPTLPTTSLLPAPASPGAPDVQLPAVPAGLPGTVYLHAWTSGPQSIASFTNTENRPVSGAATISSNLAAFTTPSVTLSATMMGKLSRMTGISGTWLFSTFTSITPCVTYLYAEPTTRLLSISLQTPVVQKILLLTAATTNGSPQTVSRLKVQVNANGAYEVNSWTVE